MNKQPVGEKKNKELLKNELKHTKVNKLCKTEW